MCSITHQSHPALTYEVLSRLANKPASLTKACFLTFLSAFIWRPSPGLLPHRRLNWTMPNGARICLWLSGRGGTWSRQDKLKTNKQTKETASQDAYSQQHEPRRRRTNTKQPKTPRGICCGEGLSWADGDKRNRSCSQSVESNWCCHGNRIPLWCWRNQPIEADRRQWRQEHLCWPFSMRKEKKIMVE